jgi:hypothetical protein
MLAPTDYEISSQHQIDHDDLDQRRGSFAGKQVGHYGSLPANSIKLANLDDDVRPNLEFGIGVIGAIAHHQRGVSDRLEASRIQRLAETRRPRQASADVRGHTCCKYLPVYLQFRSSLPGFRMRLLMPAPLAAQRSVIGFHPRKLQDRRREAADAPDALRELTTAMLRAHDAEG